MFASLGFQWWQHIIIRGLHEHCTAGEVTGSRKIILILRIQLCPSYPTIPFRLQKTISDQIVFAMKIRLKRRTLDVLGYIHHRLFFSVANSEWHFFQSSFDVTVTLLKGFDNA
jgi:hypothetical protein